MDFHGFDVNIEEVLPSTRKNVYDVNFTLDGEWYQFMYYPNNPSDNYFSDLPEEFEPYTQPYVQGESIEEAFGKLVKHYLLVKGLKGSAKDTWNDILS